MFVSPAYSLGHAHLIGIAGAGMQALMQLLVEQGWTISGSDLDTQAVGSLSTAAAAEGRPVLVHDNHAAENVPPHCDLVVYSEAIGLENPERAAAEARGIPSASYPQMLGRLMAGWHPLGAQDRQGLAIAGTHGKSTTTALTASILAASGSDPSFCIGAPLRTGGPIARSGHAGCGRVFVAEACEYRANFLNLAPWAAAILNIEPDHFDFYRTPAQLQAAFLEFARRVPRDGVLVAEQSCAKELLATGGVGCRVQTFGWERWNDWSAIDLRHDRGRYSFTLLHYGAEQCEVQLRIPGKHNVLNALAAAALAAAAGADVQAIHSGLAAFPGLGRRLEIVGSWQQATLVDDYAHHPSEVTATLATLREMFPGRRLVCVFQPHQASRTFHLLDEFAASLQNADHVAVAEIYTAREPARAQHLVTSADLAARVRQRGGEVLPVHTLPAIIDNLEHALRPGDVLVTLGAGDVRKVCHALRERFSPYRAAV